MVLLGIKLSLWYLEIMLFLTIDKIVFCKSDIILMLTDKGLPVNKSA